MRFLIPQRIDLARENAPHVYTQALIGGSHDAHEWQVSVYERGKAVDLSGYTVAAYFRQELSLDDGTLPVPILVKGNVTGNMASAVLPPDVYGLNTRVLGVMQLSDADGQVVGLAQLLADARTLLPGTASDPTGALPGIDTLLAQIDAMKAVTEDGKAAAQEARDAGAEAIRIAEEGAAEAEKTAGDAAAQALAAAEAVTSIYEGKADAITDVSSRAVSHELHAQRGPMSVTLYGQTTETGSGDKSPDNPYTITGIETATVNAGGDEITLPLLPDGSPLMDGEMVFNDVPSGFDGYALLDGSQAIQKASGYETLYYIANFAEKNSIVRSTRLSYAASIGGQTGICVDSAGALLIDFGEYTTLEEIKEALAENPMGVWYKTADYTPQNDLRVCGTLRKWRTITLDGSEAWFDHGDGTSLPKKYGLVLNTMANCGNSYDQTQVKVKSTHFDGMSWTNINSIVNSKDNRISAWYGAGIAIRMDSMATLADFKAWLAENTPSVYYPAPAVETLYYTDPLPLHKPDTLATDTVTVTGSGETSVEYPHDTKHYIDSKISELVTLALASN